MPSLLSRLASLFPGYRPRAAAPPVPPLDARLDNLVSKVKAKLEDTPSRPRPSGEEKVPLNYHGGVAGKVWFLPYQDSVTRDTPEVRAAMRLMWRDGYVVTAWEPQIRTVASEDWQVQPSEAGNPESEDQADFCKAVVEDYTAGGMVDCVRSVVAGFGPDGYTLAEPVWAVAERGKLEKRVVLSALKGKDCDTNSIRLEGDRFGNVRWVQSARSAGQERFPIEEFVYSRYMTCYDEPLGMAAFRPAYACYDDQTEVLTRAGWKLFADLTDADEVATLDPATGRMEYEVPKERHTSHYRGKMFRQQSKFIDLMVTPNHRMWVGSHTHNKFRFVEARELMDGSIGRVVKYKRNAAWEGEERATFTLPAVTHASGTGKAGVVRDRAIPARELPMDDWLRFLGLWLAEGSTYRRKTGNRQCFVTITQNPGKVLDEITDVVRRLGFTAHLTGPTADHPAATLRISNVQLWSYLKGLGKSYDKYVPTDLKQLSPRQLRILLDWMLKGDGRHDYGEGRTQYATVSKRLADDVSELALKTGKAANLYREAMPGGSQQKFIWIVGLNTAGIAGTVVNRSIDGRSWEDYDGPVSCVSTRNGIVYVRRNGKACWCGNSYWLRDTVKKLRAVHHEKRMAGFLVGTYTDDDDKSSLEDVLRRAKTSTWAAVPEGVKVEAVALSTASEPDYRSFDESLRDEIVSAIAFATLQSIQGNVPDARGDSKVQKAMADLGPWFLMARVQEAFNKQIFPKLVDYNYPYPAAGGYPKLTFGAVSNQELMELAGLVREAQGLGLKPSRKHYAKALSIQEADPNDPDDQLGGGQGGGDPFGGLGGAGVPALPPGPSGPGGGSVVPFSETEHWEIHRFRDPVKWERQANGTWKSSGGRVLSDAAYQRHLARVKRKQPAAAPAEKPVEKPAPPPGAVLRKGSVVDATLDHGVWEVGPGGEATPPPARAELDARRAAGEVTKAPGRAARKLKAAGRRVRAAVAKVARGGLVGLRLAAGGGAAGAVAYLGRKAKQLGEWLSDWGWLERNTGVGSALAEKGRRVAERFGRVRAAFDAGQLGRGSRKLVREATRLLGARWSESRKKYGAVLAAAVEFTMQAWAWTRMGVVGAVAALELPFSGATGMGVTQAVKYGSKLVGGYVRRAVEYPAKLVAGAVTGKPFGRVKRTVGAGRVAQAIEWAAGLSDRRARRARAGKIGLKQRALGLPGSRDRGGEISPQQALAWADAAGEIQRADLEGRAVRGVDAATEALVRRALAISAEGNARGYDAAAARDARNAARRERKKTRKTRLGRALGRMGFSEADPFGAVLDVREGIDELRAVLGLPPTEATDDELAGSLAVVLEEMARGLEPPAGGEGFAEFRPAGCAGRNPVESFGWSAAKTRTGRVKAVGTGDDQGKTLYGRKAEAALRQGQGQAAPGDGLRVAVGDIAAVRPGRSTPARPGKELTDVRQVRKARARAEGPTPESEAAYRELEARVRANDPAAVADVRQRAVRQAERAVAALPAPPAPAEVDRAVTAGLGRRAAGAVGGAIKNFFKGLTGLGGGGSGVSGFLGSAVKALFRGLASAGGWAVKAGARALAGVARYAARKAWDAATSPAGKVALTWVASIGVAGAVMAAPILAFNLGLIGGWATAAAVPAAAGAAWVIPKLARKVANRVGPVVGANRDPWADGGRFAEADRGEGEEWETNGRRYKRVNGRTVRVAKEPPPPASAAAGARRRAAGGGGLGDAAGRGFEGGAGMSLPGNDLAGAVLGAAIGGGAHVLGRARKWLGFGEAKDLALAGPDGRRAEELTAGARRELARLFAEKSRDAVARLLASGDPLGAGVLFSDDELSEIAAGLSRTVATADLLGRARIRRRAKMAEALSRGQAFAEGGDDPYHDFAEPVPVLVPAKAIEYVRARVPELDPGPDRYGNRLDRHATTMAIAADQTLLEKIKAAIVKELEGGGDATPEIDAILTNAGLHPGDPQYAEFVARTAVNDSLTQGAMDELSSPDMREAFPAWEYHAVRDGRARPTHAMRDGKYYPSSVAFGDVRGQGIDDVANCRCSFTPISRHDGRLRGQKIEDLW